MRPSSTLRLARRIIGGSLVLLVVVPVWRLLSLRAGPAAQDVLRLSDSYAAALTKGSVVVAALACTAALLVSPGTYERPLERLWRSVCSWSGVTYAVLLAILSAILTTAMSFYVWGAKPVLVDALAQFLHARYVAEGLAALRGYPFQFWIVTNTFVSDAGWVSQYPIGHVILLAAGFLLGAVWLVCPLLMATAVLFTALAAERLFPDDRTSARLGALLFAVSPYLITLAASHMSHVTAVALVSLGVYLALRARDGAWPWAIAAGVAVGALFATRPLSAVTIGTVVTAGVWLTGLAGREHRLRYLATRIGASVLGASPFAFAVAAYNAHFFGSPFRFGYVANFGPSHELGFHADPFGNPFEPLHGLGYTSADLLALGFFLFRSPVSAVLIVGVFLLVARRLTTGSRLMSAWALCLVPALACYWHHDLFLGPRMLSDTAPAWCVLATVAGVGLIRLVPHHRLFLGNQFSPRVFIGVVLLLSLIVGFGYTTPRHVRRYAGIFASRVTPPTSRFPVLVFVHDSWNDRVAAQLLASGMRADSVTMALARNSSCSMQEFVVAYASQKARETTGMLPRLEFGQAATDGSESSRIPSGVLVRKRADEQLTAECLRQANADRYGTIPLMPLLWQGDLPGLRGNGAMYLRDLGPVANAALVERFPERRPHVLLRRQPGGQPTIVSYEVGMETLWPEGGVESLTLRR